MSSLLRQALVCFAGLATTAITTLLLAGFAEATDFDLLGFSFCLVIPVGAILCGIAAASGYYAGGRLLQQRPGMLVALSMLLGVLGLQLGVMVVRYVLLVREMDGPVLAAILRFPDFVELYVTSVTIHFRRVNAGSAGNFGWALLAIQSVGLLLASAGTFVVLRTTPYCERCRRFLSSVGELARYTGDIDGQRAFLSATRGTALGSPEYLARLDALPSAPQGAFGQTRVLLELRRCARCGLQHVEEQVQSMKNGSWDTVTSGRDRVLSRDQSVLTWWAWANQR